MADDDYCQTCGLSRSHWGGCPNGDHASDPIGDLRTWAKKLKTKPAEPSTQLVIRKGGKYFDFYTGQEID